MADSKFPPQGSASGQEGKKRAHSAGEPSGKKQPALRRQGQDAHASKPEANANTVQNAAKGSGKEQATPRSANGVVPQGEPLRVKKGASAHSAPFAQANGQRDARGKRPFWQKDEARKPTGQVRPSLDKEGQCVPDALNGAPARGRLAAPSYAATPLFPPLSRRLCGVLETVLPKALHAARPLSKAHRASLPGDIADLSEMLTASRADLRRPYWADPGLTSAYVYYFLPWNLVRLCRLLEALPLPAPAKAGSAERSLLVDIGSGPLTLPIALWLARPDLRDRPIEVLAIDCAGRPPRIGRDILEALAKIHGSPCWTVHVEQAPLDQAARKARPLVRAGARPWLVTAANVLNELPEGRRGRFGEEDAEEQELGMSTTQDRIEGLIEACAPLLGKHPGKEPSRMLLIEPGTRLGGTTLMHARRIALEGGLCAVGPCTHSDACPLLKETSPYAPETQAIRAAGKTWCHFTFTTDGAPEWLRKLSAQAGLAKDTLSLACLMLEAGWNEEDGEELEEGQAAPAESANQPAAEAAVRVLSQPFSVPGLAGRCRYACSKDGLLLLEDAEALSSGDLALLGTSPSQEKDPRSGARIVRVKTSCTAGAMKGAPERSNERAKAQRGTPAQSGKLPFAKAYHHAYDKEKGQSQGPARRGPVRTRANGKAKP